MNASRLPARKIFLFRKLAALPFLAHGQRLRLLWRNLTRLNYSKSGFNIGTEFMADWKLQVDLTEDATGLDCAWLTITGKSMLRYRPA